MRGGVRPGAVPLAIVVQPFRLERAACLRRGFGRQACLRRGFGRQAPCLLPVRVLFPLRSIWSAPTCRWTCPIRFQSPKQTHI